MVRTTLSVSKVQPRSAGVTLARELTERNFVRTSGGDAATPSSTQGIRTSGGILHRRMLQPTQPARLALGPSAVRFSMHDDVSAKCGIRVRSLTSHLLES